MQFSSETVIEQINKSMNVMLLLHSSCQAIIQAAIEPVSSPWYDVITRELGEAEDLVVDWRRSGILYFHEDILAEIAAYGQLLAGTRESVLSSLDELEQHFTEEGKAQLRKMLAELASPVSRMSDQTDLYLSKLRTFEVNMQQPHSEMLKTIQEVQAQQADIQSEINRINSALDSLRKEIQADRAAIAAAKKARKKGIIETVFGIALAPVTGGASLILAGIGVATIAEAEDKIKKLQATLERIQQEISKDQKTLSHDKKIIAALRGLSLSTQMALDDMQLVDQSLDPLRTSWSMFEGELEGVIEKLANAGDAKSVPAIRAWFNAACKEWDAIASHTTDLAQRSISSSHVPIG